MLESVLSKIGIWLLEQGIALVAALIRKAKKRSEIDSSVNRELKAYNKILDEIKETRKNGEKVTDEQKEKRRNAARRLIIGTLRK